MDGQRDKQLKGSTDKSIKGMNDKGSHKNEWEVQRKKTKKEITARNKSLMIKPKNKWMNEWTNDQLHMNKQENKEQMKEHFNNNNNNNRIKDKIDEWRNKQNTIRTIPDWHQDQCWD